MRQRLASGCWSVWNLTRVQDIGELLGSLVCLVAEFLCSGAICYALGGWVVGDGVVGVAGSWRGKHSGGGDDTRFTVER